MKKIRVILTQDVAGVGRKGAVVDVAPGFADHGLFPSGRAVPATQQEMQKVSNQQKQEQKIQQESKAKEQTILRQLTTAHLTFRMRANTKGALYASIKPADIVVACEKSGIRGISENIVDLTQRLDHVGEYRCEIRIGNKKPVQVPITITAQD